MNELLKILEGIDKTEAESGDGWWETSIGAQFGAEKLNDIIFCFGELKAQKDELLEALETLLTHIGWGEPLSKSSVIYRRAQNAIAKAKGEV